MAAVSIARPFTDLSVSAATQFALRAQISGLLLLAGHVILVRQSVLLFPLSLLTIGWLYWRAPLAGIAVYFQFLIYQNWMISLMIDGMARETFVLAQGTNFAALAIMALIAWLRLSTPLWRRQIGLILFVVTLAFGLICVYSLIGAAKEGATSASIYFRLAATLALATLIGLDVGRVWGYRTLAIVFVVSAVFSMVITVIELLTPETYYEAINAVQFMSLKQLNDPKYEAFYSAADVIYHNTSHLFNITGAEDVGTVDILQLRFSGTVMHPISYAYILAAVCIVAWSIKQGGWLFLAVPLLLASGVKGANLLFMCSMALLFVWYVTRDRGILLFCGGVLMVGYIGLGILLGMDGGDYHVLGFLGGVNGFISNPLGHGIGVGGNLSGNAQGGFKWQDFQHLGATEFALESAVGVLLYQMGIAAVALFAVFIMLLKQAPFGVGPANRLLPRRYDILFIVLAAVGINGIFQEEAYSPYAVGLIALFCGILVANGRRQAKVLLPMQHMMTRTVHV